MKKDFEWFLEKLQKVKEHNEYDHCDETVTICNYKDLWTPTDLILREYYNNGGGSSKGFLGLTQKECIECYDYIKEHQNELRELDYYNKDGYNNFGFPLWKNYVID